MKLDEILNNCVARNDMRNWMNNPFTIEKNVYATDSHKMIWFDKSQAGDYINYDKPNNVLSAIPKVKTELVEIMYSDITKVFDEVVYDDGFDLIEEKKECEECNGEGVVEWEYNEHSNDFDCPLCNGEGDIITEVKKLNGKKAIPISKYYLDFKGKRVDLFYFYHVIHIADSLGVESIFLRINKSDRYATPVVFKIGFVNFLLMPVLKDDKENKVIYSI